MKAGSLQRPPELEVAGVAPSRRRGSSCSKAWDEEDGDEAGEEEEEEALSEKVEGSGEAGFPGLGGGEVGARAVGEAGIGVGLDWATAAGFLWESKRWSESRCQWPSLGTTLTMGPMGSSQAPSPLTRVPTPLQGPGGLAPSRPITWAQGWPRACSRR